MLLTIWSVGRTLDITLSLTRRYFFRPIVLRLCGGFFLITYPPDYRFREAATISRRDISIVQQFSGVLAGMYTGSLLIEKVGIYEVQRHCAMWAQLE